MDALEKLISTISPNWGLRRARERLRLEIATRGYDAAKKGDRTSGWIAGSTSADGEISPSLSTLRNRSRELVRNNPYASRTLNTLVSSAIGTGIAAKLGEGQEVWDAWARECDADGMLDWAGIQALALRTMHESGECLVRLRYRRPSDNLAVPLQLQVLEPDYLDALKNENLKSGGWIASGIEYDALGRRTAYWLFRNHPGEVTSRLRSMSSTRIPALDVIHLFEKTRPGQSRGVPILTPSMMKLRDLDLYEESELVRKGIEACYAAFVTTDDPPQLQPSRAGEEPAAKPEERRQDIRAGRIEYLKPGESVTFGSPSPAQGYGEYISTQLHAIAAGIGITCEQMTGDLSRVNYSSIRAGTLEFRRSIEQRVWLTFIPMFCNPVMNAWKQAAFLAGKIPKTEFRVDWTAPRFEWVDPVKDVQGELLEIAAGLKSWSEAVRGRGYDPDANIEEIRRDQEAFEKNGIAIKIQELLLGMQKEAG